VAAAGLITTAPQPQSTHVRLKTAARKSTPCGRRGCVGCGTTAFDRRPHRMTNGRAARNANERLIGIDGSCT
jgi:hypothetical protein